MKGKKTGGRVKGTPNKIGGSFKEAIANVLAKYTDPELGISGQSLMEQDILTLDGKDRIWAVTKLAEFCSPKMQSVQVSNEGEKPLTIENKLVELAKEQE